MREESDQWRWFYPSTIVANIVLLFIGYAASSPFEKPFTAGSILTITALYAVFCLPLFRMLVARPYHFGRYSLLAFSWLAFLGAASALFLTSDAGVYFSLPALLVLILGLLFSVLSAFNNRFGDRTMVIVGYTLVMIVTVLAVVAGIVFIATQLFG